MKKILFVIPTLGNGGAERSLVNLLCELPKDRYETDLLLFKKRGMFLDQVPEYVNILEQPRAIKKLYGSLSEAGLYLPVKLLGIGLSRILKSGMGSQKAFLWNRFYGPLISDFPKEYDVAIGYLGGESTYFIVDHVKAKKKLHWVHNDYRKSRMPKDVDSKLFSKVDGIVTISEECLSILKEEFPQYTNKFYNIANITSSVVVRNRSSEFYPDEYTNIKLKLLSVGRLNEQKGFDLAITAASLLKKQGVDFKWFIIGNGDLEASLNAQIQKEKVADCIELIGSRENPYPYIRHCDIFVQPSRFEGKSVVLDEAKILAKPIVATAYPTVRDQLSDGQEGIVVDITSEAVSEGILKLINSPELRWELESALKKRDYGNQDEIEKYISLLES